jgi:hypothetical protein
LAEVCNVVGGATDGATDDVTGAAADDVTGAATDDVTGAAADDVTGAAADEVTARATAPPPILCTSVSPRDLIESWNSVTDPAFHLAFAPGAASLPVNAIYSTSVSS